MKKFEEYLNEIKEYGEVIRLNKPLITVSGLPHVRAREIVLFEGGTFGEVFSVNRDSVEIILFTNEEPVSGERAVRTNELLEITVGKELLGGLIDPMGRFVNRTVNTTIKDKRSLHVRPSGILQRETITSPVSTGISVVDIMLPLGKGQKELVIGDRKSGKTSFLLTIAKSQAQQGLIIVFAAIARKRSSIKRITEFFEKEKVMDKTVVVATTSFDSPGLIYLTPYTAMSIAEYFRDNGQNVLVILDDLSAHAKFYREMSLVAGRFPGRESYPGDIFFTHARLLERAGNFKGDFSITCLPVVETIESDLTSYVATNIMSMTDGHIFFDQGTFAKGHRPAINIPLSVTRVGRQAQSPLKRDINHELSAFLSSYDRMQNLAHFGAELSGKVQNILATGDKIFTFFNQGNFFVIPEEVQLTIFALIWANLLPGEKIEEAREKLTEQAKNEDVLKMLKEVVTATNLDELILHVGQKRDQLFNLIGVEAQQETQLQQPQTSPQPQQQTQPGQPTNPPSPHVQIPSAPPQPQKPLEKADSNPLTPQYPDEQSQQPTENSNPH